MPKPQPCIFCDILTGSAPASFVYRSDSVAAFMDIQPVTPGHLLVIPLRHASSLAELDSETGANLFRAGHLLAGALRESGLRCEGVNFFLADGAAAGQEVWHVHLHVIPRYTGDGFGFRLPPGYKTSRPDRARLDELASKIQKALKSQE